MGSYSRRQLWLKVPVSITLGAAECMLRGMPIFGIYEPFVTAANAGEAAEAGSMDPRTGFQSVLAGLPADADGKLDWLIGPLTGRRSRVSTHGCLRMLDCNS